MGEWVDVYTCALALNITLGRAGRQRCWEFPNKCAALRGIGSFSSQLSPNTWHAGGPGTFIWRTNNAKRCAQRNSWPKREPLCASPSYMGFALAGVGSAAAASNKSIPIANRHRRFASSDCGSNVIGRTVLINQPLTHLLNKSRFTPAIKSVALHSKNFGGRWVPHKYSNNNQWLQAYMIACALPQILEFIKIKVYQVYSK